MNLLALDKVRRRVTVARCGDIGVLVISGRHGRGYYDTARNLPWLYGVAFLDQDGGDKLLAGPDLVPTVGLLARTLTVHASVDQARTLERLCLYLPPDLAGATKEAVGALGLDLDLSGPLRPDQIAALEKARNQFEVLTASVVLQ